MNELPRHTTGLHAVTVEGELLVLDEAHAVVHRLSGLGGRAWSLCDGRTTLDQALETLACGRDELLAALDELQDAGLVQRGHGLSRRAVLRSATVGSVAILATVALPTVMAAASEVVVVPFLDDGTVTVPVGATDVEFVLRGAGGAASGRTVGGKGARVVYRPAAAGGQTFDVVVGRQGTVPTGGAPDGGDGGANSVGGTRVGGGGGGASRVRSGLQDVAVAGGGGGAGGDSGGAATGGAGGNAGSAGGPGTPDSTPGVAGAGGTAGTGVGGMGQDGQTSPTGSTNTGGGGGGGGGVLGGGAGGISITTGSGGGGGGGSSSAPSAVITVQDGAQAPQEGDGSVVLTYRLP